MADDARHSDSPASWRSRFGRILGLGLVALAGLRALSGKPSSTSPGPVLPEGETKNSQGQPAERPHHPAVRFEHSDMSFGWIFSIMIGCAILAAVTHYAILRFFYDYRQYQQAIKASGFPLAASGQETLPPQPRLEQINRMAGIEKGNVYLRQERKQSVLNSYGVTERGFAHIPIGRAMEFIAGKLPARRAALPADQARRQDGLLDAGESNSGRVFRGGK